ncbi:MAG: zinc ribbon domain-containing protein [Thermoanaerobaculia bacterium]
MPLYEYRCEACHHRFEVLQRMGQGAEGLACPRCGEGSVERLLSTFAAHSAGGSSAASTGGSCGAPGCGSGFT